MRDAENTIEDLQERMEKLEEEKSIMQDELFTLKGVAQVQDCKIISIDNKVVDLTARSMKNNIIIQGLDGDPGTHREDCKEKVIAFFKDKMLMQVQEDEVIVAHRIGHKRTIKPRPTVVKCVQPLRDCIFEYTKNLKDKKNDHDKYYKVSAQLPEPLYTQNQERKAKIAEANKLNKTLDDSKKIKIEVKAGLLYLNEKAQKKHVTPPSVADVVNVPKDVQDKMDLIKFEQSRSVQERGSHFVGFATGAANTTEVRLAYRRLKQMIPEADHLVMAYVVKQYYGCHDAGEHAAGMKLQSILLDRNAVDTVIFVVHIFGGIHVGPKRFMIMEKVAKEALNQFQAAK